MTRADHTTSTTIKDTLENFYSLSGQNVNHKKSKILFSKNSSKNLTEDIKKILGFQQSSNFGRCLGFPITQGKITKKDYQFIIENIQNKLAGWKTRFLNVAGRTTLAKSSLNVIPTHVMQLSKLPASFTNRVDQIKRNFI